MEQATKSWPRCSCNSSDLVSYMPHEVDLFDCASFSAIITCRSLPTKWAFSTRRSASSGVLAGGGSIFSATRVSTNSSRVSSGNMEMYCFNRALGPDWAGAGTAAAGAAPSLSSLPLLPLSLSLPLSLPLVPPCAPDGLPDSCFFLCPCLFFYM
eukprot:SAG31_NODE_24042_length_490_cov_1.173913_2_plen_153_part_01